MENQTTTQQMASNLGMASLVIGIIGLFLFVMPILGTPLSVFGLGFGILGSVVGFFAKGVAIRWGLGGMGISILALAVNLGIANAPGANAPGANVPAGNIPKTWQLFDSSRSHPPPPDNNFRLSGFSDGKVWQ